VNEDATGSITALQAEIKRLREELEKARGEITCIMHYKSFNKTMAKILPFSLLIVLLFSFNLFQ